MRAYVAWGLLPLALACSFDATGIDTAAPASSTTSEDIEPGATSTGPGTAAQPTTTDVGGMTSTSGPEPTGEPVMTGPVDTTGPGPTDPSTTEPATTTESDTTGPVDPSTTSTTDPSTTSTTGPPDTTGPAICDASIKQVLLVADAQVEPPMKTEQSMVGEGTVAVSEETDSGSVTFAFNLPCSGPVAVWGRVLDPLGGLNQNDPDSFYVRKDGDPEGGWSYGCQTGEGGYYWLRVTTTTFGQNQCEDAVDWTLDLDEGGHTIRLRNREAKAGQARAAVARLLVTTDLNYVPTMDD